jgi:hypothetical protein
MVQGSESQMRQPRYRAASLGRPSAGRMVGGSSVGSPFEALMAQLATAHRMVDGLQPFSPAWDAAMAWVDDLEATLGRTSSGSTGA